MKLPLKSKKKKQKLVEEEEEEEEAAAEYNIRSLSSLVPDPELFDSDKDELAISANVKSPVFQCLRKPYHERIIAEANSINIRDRTHHDMIMRLSRRVYMHPQDIFFNYFTIWNSA